MTLPPRACRSFACSVSHLPLILLWLVLIAGFAAGAYAQQVATPTFTPNGGTFTIEKTVTVNCSTAGATIHYTTNGVAPADSDRTVASGGTVLVDRPLTLEANASKSGMTTSATAIASFVISGKLAAGQSHSVGMKSDGTVWSWGSNASGQLGIGTTDAATHAAPLQTKLNATTFLTGISTVAAGASHSLAVQSSDGSVFGWGLNSSGQLGDNSTTTRTYPVQAKTTATGNPILTAVTAIDGGAAHSIALKSDGTVWTWGGNSSGQLGDGSTKSRQLAAQVKTGSSTTLTGVAAIAAGDNFCVALKTDRTVWAWGDNASGQIGIGSTLNQKYAVQVKLSSGAALTDVAAISCGANHVLAVKSDGSVWSWGSNSNGQLGNGTTTQAKNPVQVKINSSTYFTGASTVASGASHSVILKTDRSVYACGLNSSGQLSINSTAQQLYPTQAVSSTGLALTNVIDVACGASHTLVTQTDGTVSGCGLNSAGQAGYPSTSNNPTASTLIANFFIISALADPDADGLATWRERELGTNPNNADSDGDAIPDGWEVDHGLNPLSNDAAADPDGDGFTNLQEYQNGTDPLDPFNGVNFSFAVFSGSGQTSAAGTWLPLPLVVQVMSGAGVPLPNVNVNFSVAQGGGGLSATSGGTTSSTLALRTDAAGKAAAYYRQPASADTPSAISAQTGTTAVKLVNFGASTADIPISGLKLWLNAQAGVTYDGSNGVSNWFDLSAVGNSAVWNSANKPSYLSNAINGKPAVRFSWAPIYWYATSMAGPLALGTDVSIFAVVSFDDYHGDNWLIRNDLHFAFGIDGSGRFKTLYGNGSAWNSTTTHALSFSPGQYNILESLNSSVESAFVNGVLLDSRTNPMTSFTSGYDLWTWGAAGNVVEVLIYNRALSGSERVVVENYFNRRYNVVATPPAAPTGLTAIATTPTQATLNWNPQIGVLFKIERKTGSTGTYSQIAATSAAGVTIYNDNSLSAATQYFYRIRAANMAGDSAYSNEVSVTMPTNGASVPVDGMKLWLRSDFGVTTDASSGVSDWLDESGSGNNGSQGDSSARPLFVSVGLNGKPVLRFNGANNVISVPGFLSPAVAAEAFVVTRATSTISASAGGIWSFGWNGPCGCGNTTHYPDDQGQISDDFATGHAYASGPIPARIDEPHVYNVVSSATEWTSRINGSVQFTTTNNSVAFSPWPTIGSGGWVPFYGTQYFQGDIAEVIIYNRALSQAERAAVGAYFTAKYGLEDSDGDDLQDWKEREIGTDPYNADTNGDGIPDGIEYATGLEPTNMDMDGDGLTNAQELASGTDPFLADTDGDGVSDGQDAFPLDPSRWDNPSPNPNDTTPPDITLMEPADAILLP